MEQKHKTSLLMIIGALAFLSAVFFLVKRNYDKRIVFIYPFNNSMFPPEFPSPNISWDYKGKDSLTWNFKILYNGKTYIDTFIHEKNIKLSEEKWNFLKRACSNSYASIRIKPKEKLGESEIKVFFSTDSVGAPIFFRQMPIPFIVAEDEIDSMNYVLINIGSSQPPHIALKGFSVCGNCHSFTKNGDKVGLDLDAGIRDKGGYFLSDIKDSIVFDAKNYMSWTQIEKHKTFGLFSKLSPDGRYIVTTINDRIVHKNFPYEPEHIPFSQLFFAVNGQLAIYDTQTKKIVKLKGADDENFVHTNAIWTPDGKNIIFCRAEALKQNDPNEINITDENLIDDFVNRQQHFKYNLYIIPFNDGKGGIAKPIKGASDNGKSNYFPAISPDGKWIAFCQANDFMLLQPDSKLFIVPTEGGKAKQLKCNLPLMNSWHAWSPNGHWLTFVSKGLSIYTDLFLTHIDEDGNASAPILVEYARKYRRVVNYPEFVNINPDKKFNMLYDYVEIANIQRAINDKNMEKAKKLFYQFKTQPQRLFREDYLELLNLAKTIGLTSEIPWIKEMADKSEQ